MCPHGEDSALLSCTEAAVRRRGDYRLSRLPADQPLPRHEPVVAAPAVPEIHGTPWGYARGCRDSRECPNWRRGAMTCSEARRRYVQSYTSRRATGAGTPIAHGTANGYLLGCRDRRDCPGDGEGGTCADARARYRERLAREAGIAPRVEAVDAEAAAEKVRELCALGLSLRRIAALTGCGRTTVGALVAEGLRARTRIAPATLERILALDVTRSQTSAAGESARSR